MRRLALVESGSVHASFNRLCRPGDGGRHGDSALRLANWRGADPGNRGGSASGRGPARGTSFRSGRQGGEFVAEVRTANGTVRAAPTRLDAVEVGDLVVRDVAAVVLPDEALSDNLLGLSFLSRLRRFEYSDGKLVLEQ